MIQSDSRNKIWRSFAQKGAVSAFAANSSVYCSLDDLYGNPNQFIGQKISNSSIKDLKFIKADCLATLGSEGEFLCWKIDTNMIESQVSNGGEGADPYYSLLDGRYGKIYSVIEACFFYFQCNEFKTKLETEPVIKPEIEITHVQKIFSALGIFLSDNYEECLMNELKYDRIKLGDPENETATIEKVVQCVANYSTNNQLKIAETIKNTEQNIFGLEADNQIKSFSEKIEILRSKLANL